MRVVRLMEEDDHEYVALVGRTGMFVRETTGRFRVELTFDGEGGRTRGFMLEEVELAVKYSPFELRVKAYCDAELTRS